MLTLDAVMTATPQKSTTDRPAGSRTAKIRIVVYKTKRAAVYALLATLTVSMLVAAIVIVSNLSGAVQNLLGA